MRRVLAHVAGRLVTDFVDLSARAIFGLLHIEDTTMRRLSVCDLTHAAHSIVETGQSRPEGTSDVPDGETLILSAIISGKSIELRCGRFRVRMTGLHLLPAGRGIASRRRRGWVRRPTPAP